MPIPSNQIRVAEIIMNGVVAAGGSTSRITNWPFHYRRDTITTPPSKTSLETVFNTTVVAPILLAVQADYTQTSNSVRWVDDATDPPQYVTRAGTGAIATDRMPTDQAVFILATTALKGRSYKGGKHFFPVAEAHTTTGASDVLNAGAITLYNAIATALLTPLVDADGNTWRYQVLSRKEPAQYKVNPTTVVVNQVIATRLNKRLGSMTHRKVRSIY